MDSTRYSTICRRQKHINIAISYQKSRDGLYLLFDSTGLKFLGEGKWKCKKHGPEYRRHQLKKIALQNIGELEGLDERLTVPPVANDEPQKHNQHQVYWYQNDHLGTPRELTQCNGEITWEAVYQAWGNTVTVEWQEVAQAQELNPIQLSNQVVSSKG